MERVEAEETDRRLRAGIGRRRIRPSRRPSLITSSPPSAKVSRSLAKRGGQPPSPSARLLDTSVAARALGACRLPAMPKCRHGQGRRSSSSQKCLPCRAAPPPPADRRARGATVQEGPARKRSNRRRTTRGRSAPRRRATPLGEARARPRPPAARASGPPAGLLHDLEQLDLEDERRAGLDLRRRPWSP